MQNGSHAFRRCQLDDTLIRLDPLSRAVSPPPSIPNTAPVTSSPGSHRPAACTKWYGPAWCSARCI